MHKGASGYTYFDNGIRTHGSFDYTSLRGRFSHGCHRLYNNQAVRMFSFVLAHRRVKTLGSIALGFRRTFWSKGEVYEMRLPSRGFYYELDPPLPVETLEGRIKGRAPEAVRRLSAQAGREVLERSPAVALRLAGEQGGRRGAAVRAARGTSRRSLRCAVAARSRASGRPARARPTRSRRGGAAWRSSRSTHTLAPEPSASARGVAAPATPAMRTRGAAAATAAADGTAAADTPATDDPLVGEERERDPRSDTVKIKVIVDARRQAHVIWGRKDFGVAPLEIERPRNSGPLDLVVVAPGYLPLHARAFTDRDDVLSLRLYSAAEAPQLLGYRPEPARRRSESGSPASSEFAAKQGRKTQRRERHQRALAITRRKGKSGAKTGDDKILTTQARCEKTGQIQGEIDTRAPTETAPNLSKAQ